MARGASKIERATLPLKYPYTITVSGPSDFRIVGKEGSYAGQGHLSEIRFGGLDDPLQITISRDRSDESHDRTTSRVTLTVPSQNLAFRFEKEDYKFYQDPSTKDYLSIYDQPGANRHFRLGSLQDATSNLRVVLDATPTEFAKQKDIVEKLPKKFLNVGQLTKACYTVLEHLGLVERSGERRTMTLRRTTKPLKEAQEAHR